ncbi:MAG: DUF427 domain-containing protein [Anaerosomatales bacterium]|nr:DUF427 domain-containing protein [Anaerosomatales bacterium]
MSRANRVKPGPGQESVWDYPRPPAAERTDRHIRVVLGGVTIADTQRAIKVMETSHPPVYYVPPEDIAPGVLLPSERSTFCEYKGRAGYYHVSAAGVERLDAAWSYPQPSNRFRDLAGYIAFYPGMMDECTVDGEVVVPQPGDFYGGWVTADIVGPFKGSPGTLGW